MQSGDEHRAHFGDAHRKNAVGDGDVDEDAEAGFTSYGGPPRDHMPQQF